ncbi:NADH-quinone oxidoreductase subunit C [Actinoplanes sp. TFC3]|uniref:NADH-quinone oxidoreductase subunit C n=1 Tax=Actinoplanes sp. TFC3 TaxID=1710355 RepID=UPI000A587673
MTPEEVGERMVALLTADDADASVDPATITASTSGGGPGHERAVVDVPQALWWAAIGAARDPGALGCDYFDWLSAVDELTDGFTVIAHLWSTRRKHGLLIRARVPRDNAVVESVIDLFPGAAWHERETHEMFGIGFERHPGLQPLLLPPGFEGHPLRKDFVLASRVAKAWPGAKEPGESEAGTAKRAPMRPPGVPDPNEWGPLKGKVPPPETPARRAPGDRPARPAAGDRPARPAGDRPARPAGSRPAGDRPARPAAGDRAVGDIASRATPGAPGDPKAETPADLGANPEQPHPATVERFTAENPAAAERPVANEGPPITTPPPSAAPPPAAGGPAADAPADVPPASTTPDGDEGDS